MQIDLDFSSERLESMTAAVRKVINGYKPGHKFFGNQLHRDVADICPRAGKMYPDTILRIMRRYCHHQYRTADHNRSLYERV